MSGRVVALGAAADCDVGVPESGAAVLRLRTRSDVNVPGHALLIGSPFNNLGGVGSCLRRVISWLIPLYEVVEGPLEPTKANIETQVAELLRVVQPGDQTLVYYVGHGMQGLPDPEHHDQPVTALLPIDALLRDETGPNLIPGNDVVEWLEQLADSCGVPPPGPMQRSRRHDEVTASVTMIFECCHSAGVMGDWPAAAVDCTAIVEAMGRKLEERVRRGGADPLPRVVRVMASGRDEWAQGPTVNDVGVMTHALVDLLEAHPDEPWWAVVDRLRMQWTESTQHPQIAGPDALIPLSGRRFERPADMWPCRRIARDWWHCALAEAAGCRPGQAVVLTSSLAVGGQARGRFELDEDGVLGIRLVADAVLSKQDFAWATRRAVVRRAVVNVRGGDAHARAALLTILKRCAHARDEGPKPPGAPETLRRGRRSSTVATFELDSDGVVLRDRWGDAVVRGELGDEALWESWLHRLVVLDDWLAMEHRARGWPDDGFTLRWGTWQQGRPRVWGESPPTLSAQTPVWVELEASIACMPAFVSLFRVRGDRVVEALTPHIPGGLPIADRYPLVGLGRGAEPLQMQWPPGLDGDGPQWEQLVLMVSDRPLPLVLLRRGGVRGGGGNRPSAARLGMWVRPYRLVCS
ncbi:MAG: caspase family protein [Deltaproteobacteria bacterium]|nr:caspase family protein [Deltaproteobacteria bacterium]